MRFSLSFLFFPPASKPDSSLSPFSFFSFFLCLPPATESPASTAESLASLFFSFFLCRLSPTSEPASELESECFSLSFFLCLSPTSESPSASEAASFVSPFFSFFLWRLPPASESPSASGAAPALFSFRGLSPTSEPASELASFSFLCLCFFSFAP